MSKIDTIALVIDKIFNGISIFFEWLGKTIEWIVYFTIRHWLVISILVIIIVILYKLRKRREGV